MRTRFTHEVLSADRGLPPGPREQHSAQFTRRGFIRATTGAGALALATRGRSLARAAAPWSVVLVPDPQYMAATSVCSSGPTGYDNLMSWIVENRNLPVDGVPLGIKAAIGVGDCVNSADPVFGNQGLIAAKAWSRLDAAGIHKQMTP